MKQVYLFISIIVSLASSAQTNNTPVMPGDTLYFKKNQLTIGAIIAGQLDSAARSVITLFQKSIIQPPPPPSDSLKILSISTKSGTAMLTHSVTAPAGSIIVITTAFDGQNKSCTIGGSAGLTWTKTADAQATGAGDAEIFTSTVSGGTYTITTNWGTGFQSSVVYVISGAEGVGSKIVTTATQTAPSVNITTTKANSLLIGVSSDFNGRDGSGRVYRDGATDRFYGRAADKGNADYHYTKQATAIKQYTEGISSPSTMAAGTAFIELKAKNGVTIVDTIPPSAPSLNVSSTTSNSSVLEWTTSTDNIGVTGYDIFINGSLKATTSNISYTATGLSPATQYDLYVEAKDASGNRSRSNVITVTTQALPNQAPKANAGNDITITLPNNSTTLDGTGSSDADGSIILYKWSYQSGPSQWTFGDANAVTTSLTNLVAGNYVFRLTVTDNIGAIGVDDISVTVAAVVPVDTSAVKLEGFGALAGGANTTKVYHVTNLSSGGNGSLNHILSETSPTGYLIVFDVAGTISQSHRVYTGDHFTIDGTTAPYPGITIATGGGDGLVMEGPNVHNIIVKGLTTINCSNDGIAVNDAAHDILITNCTSYGNGDGNIDIAGSTSGVTNHVTVQFCIIGNNKARVNGNSGGTLITSSNISWHHNLAYPAPPNQNEDGERFPYVHCNYSPVANPNADVRNNLIWNWGRDNSTGSGFGVNVVYGAKANVVNNYLKTIGPSIDAGITTSGYGEPTGFAYIAGNVSGNNFNYNAKSNLAEIAIPVQYQISVQDACTSARMVLQKAGITQRDPQGKRRADEQVYINGVTTLTGCPGQ